MQSYSVKTKQQKRNGTDDFSRGAAFHTGGPALQEKAGNHLHTKQLKAYQAMADSYNSQRKKENTTGLPDNLKSGIEHVSGMDISDTKVHYNSSRPAQLKALAYTQGNEIHVAPGQEKHLPHEAWHIVQQKQGRVQTTAMQSKKGNSSIAPVQKYTIVGPETQTENQYQAWQPPGWRERNDLGEDEDSDGVWFPSFRAEVFTEKEVVDFDTGREEDRYIVAYVEGPASDDLKVSDNGNLAINAEDDAHHQVFFLTQNSLNNSNAVLEERNSDFLLGSTGNRVTIRNYPRPGEERTLREVRAEYTGDDDTSELKTRCDLFYKYIAKVTDGFREILTTRDDQDGDDELTHGQRKRINRKIAEMDVTVGDVFEMMPVKEGGEGDDRKWTMHYGAVVASDHQDHVTLENFNRVTQMDWLLEDRFRTLFNSTQTEIVFTLSNLGKDLKKTSYFQPGQWFALKTQISMLKNVETDMNTLTSYLLENSDSEPTFYFNMYGPAKDGQSFMDKWKSEMNQPKSRFRIAKGI